MFKRPRSTRLAALKQMAVFVVMILSATGLRAIDPLPPELESAPLEVQAAWRRKLGRESLEERQKVAIARHEQGLAIKKRLVTAMQDEAAGRRLDVLSPVPAPLPVVESGLSTPSEMGWLALVGVLGVAIYMARRCGYPIKTAKS